MIRSDDAQWRWLPGETLDRAVVLGAAMAAAAYLAMLSVGPYRGDVALISSMGLLLAVFAARIGRWLLALPFGFAAIGAALLGADDGRLFIPALVCFWIAQALYARLFILYSEISYTPIRGYRLVAALFVVTHVAAFTLLLWPSAGALRVPLLVYIVTNLIMVLAALRLCVSNVPAGAMAFMAFNGLLGFDTFIESPRWIDQAIWTMYVLAQFMIAHGLLIQPQSNEDTARALEHAISRRRRIQSEEPRQDSRPSGRWTTPSHDGALRNSRR